MSLEFNRRSFLKYSAAAAVVMAGSTLLTGCGEDQYQPTGTLGSTLKLMGEFTLTPAKLATKPGTAIAANTLTCEFALKCTSKYGLNILASNFQVEVVRDSKTVDTYHSGDKNAPLTISKNNNYLREDDEMATVMTVNNINIKDGDTIKVKFWPRPQASEGSQAYTRAYCTWTLKVDTTQTPGYIK